MDKPLVYLLWRLAAPQGSYVWTREVLKASKYETHPKMRLPLRALVDYKVDRLQV